MLLFRIQEPTKERIHDWSIGQTGHKLLVSTTSTTQLRQHSTGSVHVRYWRAAGILCEAGLCNGRADGDDVVDVFGTKCESIYILIAMNSGKSIDRRCGRLVAKFCWSIGTHAFPYWVCCWVFGLTHWRHSLMRGRPEYSGLWLISPSATHVPRWRLVPISSYAACVVFVVVIS